MLASILFAISIHEHLVHKNVPVFWLEILTVVFFCIGAYLAWYKEYKTNESLTAKPKLDIKVEEAIIDPYGGYADCFVLASIHNLTKIAQTNVCGYRLIVTIDGRQFSSDQPLTVDGFALGHWEDDERDPFTVYKARKCSDREIGQDSLLLKVGDSPLEYGFRKSGWLRFTIFGIPKWPSYDEPTGEIYLDQDSDSGEPGDWRQEIMVTLRSDNVERVELQVRDAFEVWHSGELRKPLCPVGRAIVPVTSFKRPKQNP